MLEAFVQDGLRSLDVGMPWDPIYAEFFEGRGHIPSLETLVWYGHKLDELPYSFIRANLQLATLALRVSIPNGILETKIIPLLSGHFRNLQPLHLVWEETSIPESALQGISSLTTLNQIHLSVGNQTGWEHDWLIDHGLLRRYLAKIAFSHDSCKSSQVTWRSTLTDESERRHSRGILSEAGKYVECMPKLRWMYFG